MKYRYYVEDKATNHGITEYTGNIWGVFIECLCDCVNWFAFEDDNTTNYKITVFINDTPVYISFAFGGEINEELDGDLMVIFEFTDRTGMTSRDNITDFIKCYFEEV